MNASVKQREGVQEDGGGHAWAHLEGGGIVGAAEAEAGRDELVEAGREDLGFDLVVTRGQIVRHIQSGRQYLHGPLMVWPGT